MFLEDDTEVSLSCLITLFGFQCHAKYQSFQVWISDREPHGSCSCCICTLWDNENTKKPESQISISIYRQLVLYSCEKRFSETLNHWMLFRWKQLSHRTSFYLSGNCRCLTKYLTWGTLARLMLIGKVGGLSM